MKKLPLLVAATMSALVGATYVATVSQGAPVDTNCWDEYNAGGTRHYRTIVPNEISRDECTQGVGCKSGYRASDGKMNRLYVPVDADPKTACVPPTTTTTTVVPSTTVPVEPVEHFAFLPAGSVLPSGAECAARVRPMTENRPQNVEFNATRGSGPNELFPRATGDFVGTTDEIIQWTACKWGADEDWVRAQIVNESYWSQTTTGDFTTDASSCAPGFPIGSVGDRATECPESIGLGQVRWNYHTTAFVDDNASRSSAYNLDYTYAWWRACVEGEYTWLNTVDRGAQYTAGDPLGCAGVWYSGRWYTDDAVWYLDRLTETFQSRTWEQASFSPALPVTSGVVTTTPPTTVAPPIETVPPTTTAPTTTAPTTTTPTTTAPTTTAPTTTTPTTTTPTTTTPGVTVAGAGFVETFDGDTGLGRFDTGVFHRQDGFEPGKVWQGDHDESCGAPTTTRSLTAADPADSFYLCRDHMMTSVGHVAPYSVAWFSPKVDFSTDDVSRVSWDVNVTDLGGRQWWEVGIVPADWSSGEPSCPQCSVVSFLSDPAHLPAHPRGSIVVQAGVSKPLVNGEALHYRGLCRDWPLDPEGCGSKKIRRSFSVTDNKNGTVTIDFGGIFTETIAGSFPKDFAVVFKDHNYTPDKDGKPVGYTWHWDNVVID